MAAAVIALCVPTTGCLGDLMCSEHCYGKADCAKLSASKCERYKGCTLEGTKCSGAVYCSVLYGDDSYACDADLACNWERNCN